MRAAFRSRALAAYYEATVAEGWFVDEETARRAGFKRGDVNQK